MEKSTPDGKINASNTDANDTDFVCAEPTRPKTDTMLLSQNGIIDKRAHELEEGGNQHLTRHVIGHVNTLTGKCTVTNQRDEDLRSASDEQGSNFINGQIDCAGCHDSDGEEKATVCKDPIEHWESSTSIKEDGLDEFSKDRGASRTLSSLVIKDRESDKEIQFIQYESEKQLPDLVALITIDLSEPYSIYTYRYFLHNWPHLSHLAYDDNQCVGAIVCKLDIHRKSVLRGYIAMLVVHRDYRRCKIGSSLVKKAVKKMREHGCEEVVLETEVTNKAALQLYENLGFVRDKRLFRYYLNGVDAWRLKLWLK